MTEGSDMGWINIATIPYLAAVAGFAAGLLVACILAVGGRDDD